MLSRDWITRGLLAGILVCLLALLVQGRSPTPASAGRYLVSGENGGSNLVRIDTLTGRSWRLRLDDEEARWEPFSESPVAPAARRVVAAAPGRPRPTVSRGPVRTPAAAAAVAVPSEVGNALLNPRLSTEVRIWAAYQLAQVPGDATSRVLIQALADSEPRVVHAALEALAGRRSPRIRAALEGIRAHPDPYVSRRVSELLRERG